MRVGRRVVLAGLLQGCAAPFVPLGDVPSSSEAEALLTAGAVAHGSAALAGIADISVRYAGQWRPLVGRMQPELVDEGFRGGSEERLLLGPRLVGQAHTGPLGMKQVVRHAGRGAEGDVRVWFNGTEARDRKRRDAAALVADGYGLFLLGPMSLVGKDRVVTLAMAPAERITVFDETCECDVVRASLAPGLGFSERDELLVYLDRATRLMRRVRFTLDGLESTQGAIAEVDTGGHVLRHGVQWPTRFHERLLRPVPLGVHDWRLEGLDVNRGMTTDEVETVRFEGKAKASAALLF